MNAATTRRDKVVQGIALAWLLVLGGLALLGPYGVLAWGEQSALLGQRKAEIAKLSQHQMVLQNRVERLNPKHVDPDLASELVRKDLNVARSDEYVIDLPQKP